MNLKDLVNGIAKVVGQPTQEQRDRAYKDAIGEGELSPSPIRQGKSAAEKEELRKKFGASSQEDMDKAKAPPKPLIGR